MEVMEFRREEKNCTHRDMVDHVFLHRKVAANPNNLHRTELKLLDALTATIVSMESEIFPSVVRQLFTNMKQMHCDDDLNPKEVSKQLANMKHGEMLGIYVRAQNCGLFIHMRTDDEVTLSTFSPSLPNEVIYGENINSDIQVIKYFEYSQSAHFYPVSKFLGGLSNACNQSQIIDNVQVGGFREANPSFERYQNESCHGEGTKIWS